MPGSQYVQSLQRAIAILRAIADEDDGLQLSQITAKTALKAPTTANLVRTLVHEKFLNRGPDGLYRLGSDMLAMAGRLGQQQYYSYVEQALRELAGQFPSAVLTYVELEGINTIVRIRVSPDRPGTIQRPGARNYPVYAMATGLCALAFCDEETHLAFRQHYPFYQHGAQLWDSPEALDEFLDQVRTTGYAIPPFSDCQILRICAALLDSCDNLVGMIGLSCPPGKTDAAHFSEQVTTALKIKCAELSSWIAQNER